MNQNRTKRKLTAILSADVVGYSRLMEEDEEWTIKTLEENKTLISEFIEEYKGRVVDAPGDNILAEFSSVTNAVECAVKIQKELKYKNANLIENRRMEFRIGVNLGEVVEEDGRIYGSGVNIAARLEGLTEAGGVCISRRTYDHVKTQLDLSYEYLGEQCVKNISEPIRVYRILMDSKTAGKVIGEKRFLSRLSRRIAIAFIIILIAALAGSICWNIYSRGPSIEQASIGRMAYPLPDKPSIAVLPFTNMSGDPEQEYIGDGLSENIISALSVSSQMFVMSRSATFTYKEKPVKPQQVAEDLGVQYVLEGSIVKSGDRLRVTAQLIDALAGHHLWAEKYDREMRDLFELQDEITKKIVVSIGVELGGGEDFRLYARSTDSLEAWKCLIKGAVLFSKNNPEDNAKAREYYKAALDLDPEYVGAMSMLAATHLLDGISGWSDSPITSMNRGFKLAQKAVALDEQDPVAHMGLGVTFLYQRQHKKAIIEGKRAITLNPNYASGHVMLAQTMLYSGRFDEAITLTKKAYRLDPDRSPARLLPLAGSYVFLGRYEEALEVCKQMEEDFQKAFISSWVYQELDREEEARTYMAEGLKMRSDRSLEFFKRALPFENPAHLQRVLDAFRKAGMPEKAPEAVQEKPSIAVLPFSDRSLKSDQGYFADGLSEELITYLSRISDLQVRSKTSSFAFKGTKKPVKEIAKILEIEYVLEGSVRKAGNDLRITAQLIHVADDRNLWSQTYDHELKDIFKIQKDIAHNIADKLKLTLESLKLLGGTENIEAYEFYLKAKGKRDEVDIPGYESALVLIDKAIELDPEFSVAWAYKANIHHLLNVFGPYNKAIAEVDAGIRAAEKAIALEPNLEDGYIYLGYLKAFKSEWIDAEHHISKALELIGDSLSSDHGFIIPYYLNVGEFKRAHELLNEMRQNDPIDQAFLWWYYHTYGVLGDRQQAEKEYQLRNELLLKGYSGWHDEAITQVRLGSGEILSRDEILSSDPIHVNLREYLYSPEAGLVELRRIYNNDDKLSHMNLHLISIWAAYFGDFEFAMDVIEKDTKINATVLNVWYPTGKAIRKTTRFKKFVREIGLVDYWKKFGWPDLCHPVGDDDFVCD